MQIEQSRISNKAHAFIRLVQLVLLVGLIIGTNNGFLDRVDSLFGRQKWLVLSVYVAVWGLSLLCLAIAVLQPNRLLRSIWAVMISLTTAAAYSFYLASGSDLNVYYLLSFWAARHEVGRAVEFYREVGVPVAIVAATFFAVMYLPPTVRGPRLRHYLSKLAWAPILPVIVIAAIIVARNGSGSQAMPRQFQPLAIGIVAAGRIVSDTPIVRADVTWSIKSPFAVRKIIVLVDESIRADYIDWRVGNPHTPVLAANKNLIANYGPAVSGANCSSYSNAILRLGGARRDFVNSVRTNPTIWQFAKQAGFRTVYIDGQSGFIKSDKKLQNFMTVQEMNYIDRHVTFDSVPAPQLDFELLSAIADEVSNDTPVFIYANKNGAHFPYDAGYPPTETIFRPVTGPSGKRDPSKMINSYRNVVRWSVDTFFGALFEKVELKDTVVIYTSDHGQNFAEGRITHCSVGDADPREVLVPLFAITKNDQLKARFEASVAMNYARLSHFAIAPTIFELMGYDPKDIGSRYDASLFEPQNLTPAFTTEYIFGLFSSDVNWTTVDLSADYRERPASN